MNADTLRNLGVQVCQYFLDFLESDFKRQQAPKRRVVLQTDSGFKAGMRIAPYADLNKALWGLLQKPVNHGLTLSFPPRRYLRGLSQPLVQIIREQVKAITADSVSAVVVELVNKAQSDSKNRINAPELWLEEVHEVLRSEIGTQLVRPMLALIDDALQKHAYSQVDSAFAAELDLVALIAAPLEQVLTDVLASAAATGKFDELKRVAEETLALSTIQKTLTAFFESYAAADAFLELRDIETYASTAEGIQLYLYIGTLKFGSALYPLFYIPIEVDEEPEKGGYNVKITGHLYTNRRAIDFALQELGERQSRQWMSPIKERITYLDPDVSISATIEPYAKKLQEAFGLFGELPLQHGSIATVADTNVAISNALHICAFEKSDEALLNDYEELIAHARQDKEGVLGLFEDIVAGVITKNPTSIEGAIDAVWDGMPVDQRVVPDTPIPLNEEQLKILQAIKHSEGRFIVVEGPPGTGKSHTIVAIAADCAFNKRSCLVLSDKREALEVVHAKLSAAMNEVRGHDEFPNPLLRIGTEQVNFRKLISQQVLTQVQAHAKASAAHGQSLKRSKQEKREALKKNVRDLQGTLGKLSTRHLAESQILANELDLLSGCLLSSLIDGVPHTVVDPKSEVNQKSDQRFEGQLNQYVARLGKVAFDDVLIDLQNLCFALELRRELSNRVTDLCPALLERAIQPISNILFEYVRLKRPIIGYLFRGAAIASLSERLQGLAPFSKQLNLRVDSQEVNALLTVARAVAVKVVAAKSAALSFDKVYSYFGSKSLDSDRFFALREFVLRIKRAGISELESKFCPSDNRSAIWLKSLAYFTAVSEVKGAFESAPDFDYVGSKTEVERLNTSLMNAEVDSRLVTFMQESRADARVLAKLIKDKQKFPEDKFGSVKEAFPVIIASIREFGEYMPLKTDIFDVLVIDEASQVSVAQAFPALLRARKIVVMGDSKQFSNTKSSNASIALNDKYRSNLTSYFKRQVADDAALLQRLSYFDVKKSVLEFAQLCANFSIMLRKHFRSYQELIGYSSKTFYGGQLQAIKIRAKPLSEVIRFSILEDDSGQGGRNTNKGECEFILRELVKAVELSQPPTIGVITPFKEQQSLISREIANHSRYQEFRSKLKIKVMTFDSCQGEERNWIFYSMVATKDKDSLNYVFPVSLEDPQESVEFKLKVQRLNVGFSRAQEMVWFVLSKPLEEFKGAIGQALRHFELVSATTTSSRESTDPNSPMEKKVHDWIYATSFYQKFSHLIEVMPQFPLGDYLRQLDPTYKHPAWKVDFLLTVRTPQKGNVNIVIEYDGFEFHFKDRADIDVGNHERYLNDNDIERQFTLESYGYRFIRLNRFNVGRDPVESLSVRLYKMMEKFLKERTNEAVQRVQSDVASLMDKSSKQCQRCDKIKPLASFFDKSLNGGHGAYGRVCAACKGT